MLKKDIVTGTTIYLFRARVKQKDKWAGTSPGIVLSVNESYTDDGNGWFKPGLSPRRTTLTWPGALLHTDGSWEPVVVRSESVYNFTNAAALSFERRIVRDARKREEKIAQDAKLKVVNDKLIDLGLGSYLEPWPDDYDDDVDEDDDDHETKLPPPRIDVRWRPYCMYTSDGPGVQITIPAELLDVFIVHVEESR